MRYLKPVILPLIAILASPVFAGAEVKTDSVTSILMLDEYLPRLVRKTERSVVRVLATQPKGDSFYGGGAIISADGYVLTAWHVIEDPKSKIVVEYLGESAETSDREALAVHMIPTPAKLVGYAPDIDLALLKIEVPDLPYLSLGGPLERGRLVIAIGHPFDRYTATLGIVSHVGHNYKGIPFDLSDAEINSGNSGGPLVNMRGELIGIYVARFFTHSEPRHEGLGGLISATDIKLLLPRLKKEDRVVFGYTGLNLRGYDPNWDERYEALPFDSRDELLVVGVEKNSPAANVGLMTGDKITAIDGKKFLTQREFMREVLYRKPGDTIVIDILRDGKSVHYKLRLGIKPPEQAIGNGENHEKK